MATPDNDNPSSAAAPPASSVRPSWETARPAPPRPPTQRPTPAVQRPIPAPSYAPPAAAAYQAPAYQPPAYQPPADLTENVKYDLAGNPIPGSGSSATAFPAAAPMAPPSPFGYSAGPAAGTWPPPPGGAGYGAHAYRNNSGEQSHLPPELERLRWHWGAFFFPILWTKKHGLTTIAGMLTGGLVFLRVLRMVFAAFDPLLYLGICVFYGVAYFGLQVYGGLNGHKIGWRNRHFPGGVEEYFKVQSAWMWWGFGINIVAVPLLYFAVFAAIIAAAFSGHSPNSGTYGSYNNGSGSYGSGYHRHYYGNGSASGSGSTDNSPAGQ